MLYNQDDNGLWKKSYYEHLKYRHNVRFSSVSFTLLLVTSVVAVQMIIGLVTPFNKVEITYADTFAVTNTDNDGVGSLRRAVQLATLNPGADTINITVSGTLTLLSNITVSSDTAIDASGVDFIISGDPIIRLGGDNITIDHLQFANSGISVIDAYDNISLDNLVMNGSDLNKAISFSGGSDNTVTNATVTNYLTGLDIQNAATLEVVGGSFSDCDHEGIHINDSQDVTIGNASLFDNGWAGINIDNSATDIYIHHSQIYNNSVNGINFNSFGNNGSGSDSLFTANDIYNNNPDGINLQDIEGTTNFSITGNDLYSNDRSGIFLTNADDLVIGSNNIYSNNDGISVTFGSDGNEITFNSIYSNINNGIGLQNAINNAIGNNYIGTNDTLVDLGNGQYGIDLSVDTTHDNLIGPNNTISYNNSGILIHQDSYSNDIRQNDITQNDTIGIFINAADTNSVGPDNTISDNNNEGVRVQESSSTTISSNIISGNSHGISLTPNSDSSTVSDNEIYSNSESGINIKSNSNTISGNYIGTNSSFVDLGNTEDGITLESGSSSNVLNNNYLYHNDLNGIAFLGASVNNTVSSNEIKQNNLNGISIRDSSDSNTVGPSNTITDNVNYGIEISNSKYNKITQNIINNSDENIYLNNGNEDLDAPTILTAVASANKFFATGTAVEDNGVVEIFGSDTEAGANGFLEQGSFSDGAFDIQKTEDITATHTHLAATFTDSDSNTSELASLVLTIDTTAPVSSASISGGTYSGAQTISLSATDNNDHQPKIFYTTDGSTPTDDSAVYSEAITINETTVLKFFAGDNVDNAESVHTEEYVIEIDDTNANENQNINQNLNINESFLSIFQINNINVDENTNQVRTTDNTPTFAFADVPESKVGSKIIVKIKQRQQEILTLTKKVNKNGRANITVPDDEALDKGNYKIYTGVLGEDNLALRTKLQIIDFPPNLDLISEVITDEDLPIASTGEKVTASLWDNLGERATATSTSSTDGIFVVNFAATPAAGYEYTLKAIATSNGVSSDEESKTVFLTPNEYVETLVAIPGAEDNKYRLTYVNPKISGLAPAGKTPIIYLDDAEQGSATIQEPCSGTCSWYYQLKNVSVGVHYAKIVIDNSSYTMIFKKDLAAIAPKVVSHEDGGSYNKPPLLTIIGHATDKLYIYDQDLNVLKEAAFDSLGVYKFNTSPYVDYGLNVFKFRAQDSAKYSSYTTFAFNLRRPPATPLPQEPEPEEIPEETNANINTNANANININENINLPVNGNINQGVNINYNANLNSNINANENININEPVLSTEEEQWLDIVTEEVIEKYNQDQAKNPPPELPYLTAEKEPLTAAEKEQLAAGLTNDLQASQNIVAYVDGERISPEKSADGLLKFKFTKQYDLSSLINRLLKLSNVIIGDDSLIVEGQISSSQIKNSPAYAFVIVYSDPVIKMAQVDKDGRWTITIPLELLPPGEHTAFAQTEVNGTKSQQVELAKFAVEEKIKLSKTTWLVIINVAIAVLLLLTAIIVQAVRNKKIKIAGGADEK